MAVTLNITTLKTASKAFFAALGGGTTCPCCKRKAKSYTVPFSKHMAQALLEIATISEGGKRWVDVSTECSKDIMAKRVYGKLVFWNLLSRRRAEGKTDYFTGAYHVTKRGMAFLKGEANIFEQVLVFDNNRLQWQGTKVNIQHFLVDFDYKQDVLHTA